MQQDRSMAVDQPRRKREIHPRQYEKENFCRISGHQSAYLNGKIYISGGLVHLMSPWSEDIEKYANEYLRVINTTGEPFKVGRNAPHTAPIEYIQTEERVPVLDSAALWVHRDELYFFGGKVWSKTGTEVDDDDADISEPTIDAIWKYSPAGNEWSTHGNVITAEGNPVDRVWLGGSAVVPTIQKGYFFGGLANDKTPVREMIIRDFALETYELQEMPWVSRFEGALVHVQAGRHGILLAFGGSITTGDPIPMSQIAIFDPESNNFTQSYQAALAADATNADDTGLLPERGPLCAVVARAKDNSSYQIYMFGGFNYANEEHFNDVWILSIPSFLWFRASSGSQESDEEPSPRFGHRCELVGHGRRTMMVYGGTHRDLEEKDCESIGVYAYDLTTLTWLSEYNPDVEDYQVPEVVYSVIGGGPDGGATLMPKAGFSDPIVEKLFTTDESPPAAAPPETTIPPAAAIPPKAAKVKPGIIAGSVVGAILAMTLLVTMAVFLYKRRRRVEVEGEEDGAINSGVVHQPQLQLGVLTVEGFGMPEREDTVSPIEVYSPVLPYRPFSTSALSQANSYEMPV